MSKEISAVASAIRSRKAKILHLWEQRAKERIDEAQFTSRSALRDSLPELLDTLADNLEIDAGEYMNQVTSEKDAAKKHGLQRAGLGIYLPEDVVYEYQIFHKCVFEVLEEEGQLPKKERMVLADSIFLATRVSVAYFCSAQNTQREQAMRETASQLVDLESERELREKFVSTLSHDLRSPLTAARMSAELLLKTRDDREHAQRLVARIIASLGRADTMIGNLLDANRLKAGEHLPLEIEAADSREVVKESIDELAATYGDRLMLKAPDSVPGYWDRQALRRITENLISNALKYGSIDKGVSVGLQLLNDDKIELTVHNWGSVIPRGDLESMFLPFRRSGAAKRGNIRGWGIGLTLVEGMVRSHGGTVRVESNEKSGTTFTVTLPLDSREHYRSLK